MTETGVGGLQEILLKYLQNYNKREVLFILFHTKLRLLICPKIFAIRHAINWLYFSTYFTIQPLINKQLTDKISHFLFNQFQLIRRSQITLQSY